MAQQMDGKTSYISEQVAQAAVAFAAEGVQTVFRFEDMLIVQLKRGVVPSLLTKTLGPPAEARTNLYTGTVCFWWIEHP